MSSQFVLAPGEEFLQCPYNQSHRITNVRMCTHLVNCRKAYLKTLSVDGQQTVMSICRYNHAHHVPKIELAFHEENCAGATSALTFLSYHNSTEGKQYYDGRRQQDLTRQAPDYNYHSTVGQYQKDMKLLSGRDTLKASTTPPATVTSQSANDTQEEDWEAESNGYEPGYDPDIKLKSNLVMYNPPGLTKSERKSFRNKVRVSYAERELTGRRVDMPVAFDFYKSEIKTERKKSGHSLMMGIEPVKRKHESDEVWQSFKEEEKEEIVPMGRKPRPSSLRASASRNTAYLSGTRMESKSSLESESRTIRREAEREEEEDWPWPSDGTDDIILGDDDDFAGFDPYTDE